MKYLTTFFLFLSAFYLTAQSTTIEGTVRDAKGEPIIAANIGIVGSYDGTSSDVDGSYRFTTVVTDTAILAISAIGYESQELRILPGSATLLLDIELRETVSELTAVTITAGSFEASDEKRGTVLKPLDIVTTAGATADIYGALNTLPGTTVNGEAGQIFVRGGAAYETRTFVDGILVAQPYFAGTPDVPQRGRFSPFEFKGTLFSTGAYSAEYGQALSSALVLETQDLPEKTQSGITLLSVGASANHTERRENDAILAAVNYVNMAPYFALVPQRYASDKAPESIGAQLGYKRKTKRGLWKTQLSGNEFGVRFTQPGIMDVTTPAQLSLRSGNYFVQSSYQGLIDDQWSISGAVAASYDYSDLQEGFEVRNDEYNIQGRIRLLYQPTSRLGFKMGMDTRMQEWREVFDQEQTHFEAELSERYAGLFVESDYLISNDLVMRFGVRSEYSHALDAVNLAPRLSLAYRLDERSQVSFAAGRYHQTPENTYFRYDTEALRSERADHYVLNYQYTHEKRTLRAEAYYKQYDQLARFEAATPWLIESNGSGYARGLDLFYRDQQTITNGDFWVSYSLLDTRRRFRGYPEAATPSFAATHSLSVVYKHWIPQWNTLLSGTYQLGSGRPYDDPNTPAFQDARMRPFQNLSTSVSYLTTLFGQETVIFGSITNVLGLEQSFGRRYSSIPDDAGFFPSIAVTPQADRMFVVAVLVSL